ncbi:YybS family protein [Tindallia californiensis]|uniref:Uncharacterized conserved protein YybS, DUF2232 family n=1 Tax=Tindallia californiensis TaxID=159292 RepID=A0A1H3QI86_9FIRM|nr:YybS family protein [Tindallia californiensis]SDZ13304.1 Uncharacterized conserved protein YybS, DUF2232 family [Tindallia californiensis]
MEQRDRQKAMIEAAMIATLTTIFVLGTVYIPVLSILMVLIPVPFLVLAARRSTRYAFFSLLVTVLLIGVLTGILYSLLIFVIFGPLAIVMGAWIRKEKHPHEIIFAGAFASAAATFLLIYLIGLATGIQLTLELGQMFENLFQQQIDSLQQLSIDPATAEEMIQYVLLIIPGLIMVQALFGAFINYYLTVAVLRRSHSYQQELPEFSRFKLPGHVVMGSFLVLMLSWLTSYADWLHTEGMVANTVLLIVMVFFMQGLSVISFWIKRTRVPKWLRIVVLLSLVIISPIITVIAMLGLLESMINFRKISSSK